MTGKVLSVASECVPLLKTGGLADVVGALPKALAGLGWDMRVLMPAFRGIALPDKAEALWSSDDLFGGPARVVPVAVGGVDVLLLDAPHLYDRAGGPYTGMTGDHADNPERFAALSWAGAEIARHGLGDGWTPDILHAHDWQGGFAPAYLAYGGPTKVKSVITVHNIAFQGLAPASSLAALRLPASEFYADGLEYYGQLSALKAGLITADAITTVSPTYANELMRPAFGMGLEGVIAARADRLHGILNGVDTELWNPEADPAITTYSARSLKRKKANRDALRQEFGLEETNGPLAILVSRLTDQKGIDLVLAALPGFLEQGGTLAVLGTGDKALEDALAAAVARHPGRVALHIGYDEDMSHRMFAGGDAVLVPSRFEPCGLTQMYGLRYGTIPVVAATGGLADTVITANPAALAAGAATGIAFHPTDTLALQQALRLLSQLYADASGWAALQRRAMRQPVGWETSSAAYAALYSRLLS